MSEEEAVVDEGAPEEQDATSPSLIGRVIGLPMTLIRRPLLGVAFLTVASVAGIKEAAQVLSANLDPEGPLTPASTEWRDSLFAMGRVHYLHGTKVISEANLAGAQRRQAPDEQKKGLELLAKAIDPFNEAARALSTYKRRFPSGPDVVMAAYMAGDARRQIALYLQYRREIESIEITRRNLSNQIKGQLTKSVGHFDSAINVIQTQSGAQMSQLTKRVLRNSYFNKADALFGLESFAAAELAYSDVISKYREQPITLEACVQMARCHRRLKRLNKASGSIEQAKIILKRIGEKGNFAESTRYTNYKDWEDLLDLLGRTYTTKVK